MAEQLKTTSKGFNTYIGGLPRGFITLFHINAANPDLFRLALLRLFTHPMNYAVKIFDFHGDFSDPLLELFKLKNTRIQVDTSLRYQVLMPTLVQTVRGPNPPDVVIINDMDALIRINPNDYRRLMAIVMNTKTSIILLAPVSTVRDPRKTRFMKVLKRLEVSLPLVLEASMGDLIDTEYQFSIKVIRGKVDGPDRKILIGLPYREVSPEQRARKRIIPSQVIATGKFPDRGVLSGSGTRFTRTSYDDGVVTQTMTKPGELRGKRGVGGAQPLSENLVEAAMQIEAQPHEKEVIVAQPGVIQAQQPREEPVAESVDFDPVGIKDEDIVDLDLPEVELIEADPVFTCAECGVAYSLKFRSDKAKKVAMCKYCMGELQTPTQTLAPNTKLGGQACFHCGSPNVKPISAAQKTREGTFSVTLRCGDCKKTFQAILPANTFREPSTEPPRTARGMKIEGDRGTPAYGIQPMLKPGQGVSVNASLKPKELPGTPASPTQVDISEDHKDRGAVRGFKISSGDASLDMTHMKSSSLNSPVRVSPVLSDRMGHKDKMVQTAGIKMRVQVRGEAPAVSIVGGAHKADGMVGIRYDKGPPQGGTKESKPK